MTTRPATVATAMAFDGDATVGFAGGAATVEQGIVVRRLGVCDYRPVWQAMRDFTVTRGAGDADQIWLLQHHAVFTQGAGCRTMPRAGDGEGVGAGDGVLSRHPRSLLSGGEGDHGGDGEGNRDGDGDRDGDNNITVTAAAT